MNAPSLTLFAEHEMIWNTILDDKLARKSSSSTMSYFMKLQDLQNGLEGRKLKSDSSVFLNPEEIIQSQASNQISAALSPPINILIPNNIQGSLPKREGPTSPSLSVTSNTSARGGPSPNSNSNSSISTNYNKPLPINLSTLLPVSKNNLGDVSGNGVEMPKFGLNIPGFQECRNLSSSVPTSAANGISQQPQERDKSLSTIQWPGIEAVIDSYKKYSQGKLCKVCTVVPIGKFTSTVL